MESAEECVTTHLPKQAVPKTDGAQAGFPYCPKPIPARCKAARATNTTIDWQG